MPENHELVNNLTPLGYVIHFYTFYCVNYQDYKSFYYPSIFGKGTIGISEVNGGNWSKDQLSFMLHQYRSDYKSLADMLSGEYFVEENDSRHVVVGMNEKTFSFLNPILFGSLYYVKTNPDSYPDYKGFIASCEQFLIHFDNFIVKLSMGFSYENLGTEVNQLSILGQNLLEFIKSKIDCLETPASFFYDNIIGD